jgi:hypothetical protein
LKYNAPVIRASPSLSSAGAEALAPKYLSSKSSYELAALVALEAAAVAELAALVSLVAALVSDVAAAAALAEAAVADPRMLSTYVLFVKSGPLTGTYVVVTLELPMSIAPVIVPPVRSRKLVVT